MDPRLKYYLGCVSWGWFGSGSTTQDHFDNGGSKDPTTLEKDSSVPLIAML